MNKMTFSKKIDNKQFYVTVNNARLNHQQSRPYWEINLSFTITFGGISFVSGEIIALFEQHHNLTWDFYYFDSKGEMMYTAENYFEQIIEEELGTFLLDGVIIPKEKETILPVIEDISILSILKNDNGSRLFTLEFQLKDFDTLFRFQIYSDDKYGWNTTKFLYKKNDSEKFDIFEDYHTLSFHDGILKQLINYINSLPTYRVRSIFKRDDKIYYYFSLNEKII